MTIAPRFAMKKLPRDVKAFIHSTELETVFLNAAVPFHAGMIKGDL